MYPVGIVEVLGLALFFWILILTFFIWQIRKGQAKLFPNLKMGDFGDKLEEVLKELEQSRQWDLVLNKNLRAMSKEGLAHIQNTAILRYNPYEDTGGNMSFSIALLNGVGSGFVLTSLHTRAGTRIYAKSITNGESELELSKEEKRVLREALKEENESNN